jgi:hypothetical protein
MDAEIVAIIVAAVVIALLVLVIAIAAARSRRRDQQLHERFGPEYDRTVGDRRGRDRRHARDDLADRLEEREQLDIHPLGPGVRERYIERWQETQARFVDAPQDALSQAETLLDQVMRERGYPVDDDFDRQADLISVDHPDLVENYRGAHSLRVQADRRTADTEAMRDAMLRYRSLFDELLAPEPAR